MKLTIDCPYSTIELRIATIGLEKKITDSFLQKFHSELEKKGFRETADQSERNLIAAKWHGITLEALINSPNYEVLIQNHQEHFFTLVIQLLKSMELTDKEAWAFTCMAITGDL